MPRVHVLTGAEITGEVTRRVVESVLARVDSRDPRAPTVDEIVEQTLYYEEARLDLSPDLPLAPSDRAFISKIRHELAHRRGSGARELVYEIVERYANEISGHFDPRVYSVATRVLPPALGAVFGGRVGERVLVEGETRELIALAHAGTVVLAPTHVSNLDAVALGYAIHCLGLPPFAYGAGLNLFTSAVIGFFMRNLGAYTVDRSKKDPLYKATLLEYTTVLLERGQHNLFFAGGTRSRSGRVEGHLKKGLLGTTTTAFRHRLAAGAPHPRIFVVPCTISYPLVLEASTLASDWLRAEGGPQFVDVRDELERPRRWIDFVRGLAALEARIHVRIGRALDPVGNAVDIDGASRDARGRRLDPARYFLESGALTEDERRDAEYTRLLAKRLLETYRRDTVALPTNILAYAVFARLWRERSQPNLFRFIRSLLPDAVVSEADVRRDVARMLFEVRALERRGAIRVAPEVRDPGSIISQALASLRAYHPTPVIERRDGELHVGDANLLLYYRNRLDGYGLLADVKERAAA